MLFFWPETISKQFNFKYNKHIWYKICGKGIARAGKEFILIISNEDMNDFINIKKKTLKDSGVLIDGVTETAKHKKK